MLSSPTLVGTDSSFGFGVTRWLAGIAFSLGLILVVIAGAELFTGNNLMVMAVASRQVTAARLVRTWAIVYAGNFVGALSIVAMVMLAGWWTLDDKAVGSSALSIAAGKTALPFGAVFSRGILANALVCLAVWLATGRRSLTDKVVAIVPPVAAFVANGFEYSVANMYFIPMGLVLKGHAGLAATTDTSSLTMGGSSGTSRRRRSATSLAGPSSLGSSIGSCTCAHPMMASSGEGGGCLLLPSPEPAQLLGLPPRSRSCCDPRANIPGTIGDRTVDLRAPAPSYF